MTSDYDGAINIKPEDSSVYSPHHFHNPRLCSLQGYKHALVPFDVPLISEDSPVKRPSVAVLARSVRNGRLGRLAQGRPAPGHWVSFAPYDRLKPLDLTVRYFAVNPVCMRQFDSWTGVIQIRSMHN